MYYQDHAKILGTFCRIYCQNIFGSPAVHYYSAPSVPAQQKIGCQGIRCTQATFSMMMKAKTVYLFILCATILIETGMYKTCLYGN